MSAFNPLHRAFTNQASSTPDPGHSGVFCVTDIKSLVQQFPPFNAMSYEAQRSESTFGLLLQSSTNFGLIRLPAALKTLQTLLDEKTGRLSSTHIAKRLDLDSQTLVRHCREDKSFLVSSNGNFFFTRCEQARLVQELHRACVAGYVKIEKFARCESIDESTIDSLLAAVARGSSVPTILDLSMEKEVPFSASSRQKYLYAPPVEKALRELVVKRTVEAERSKRGGRWVSHELLGLSPHDFKLKAEQILRAEQGLEWEGKLSELANQTIEYLPKSFIVSQFDQSLLGIADGKVPFLDLRQCLSAFPEAFENIDAAKSHLSTGVRKSDGSKSQVHICSNHVISYLYLVTKASEALDAIETCGYVDIQRLCLSKYPTELKSSAGPLLLKEIFFATEARGFHKTRAVRDYVITNQFYQNLVKECEAGAARQAIGVQEHRQEVGTQIGLDPSALHKALGAEPPVPQELWETLWAELKSALAIRSMEAFSHRLEKLQAESEARFASFWKVRVINKSQLLVRGLEGLEEGNVRDQLTQLLSSHLGQELIPDAISRARKKGLLLGVQQKTVSQLGELQVALKNGKLGLDSILDKLEQFSLSIDISASNSTELQESKRLHLLEMAKGMRKEVDPGRLFLSLIIIHFAAEQPGVVHASGRFAPKLLKMVKIRLDAGQAACLEEIKEAVKRGPASEEIKEEMRDLALKKLGITASSVDREGCHAKYGKSP